MKFEIINCYKCTHFFNLLKDFLVLPTTTSPYKNETYAIVFKCILIKKCSYSR